MTLANDREMRSVARAEAKRFVASPGGTALSIGIVMRGDAISIHAGTVAPRSNEPPTDRTIYEIGSITKTFASTVLAHAVLEGRVALDDDIRRYLPDELGRLDANGEPIRLVHLANLTSGLPNWLPDPGDRLSGATPDEAVKALIALHQGYDMDRLYADLANISIPTPPGAVARHSNVAAQLLAAILARVYQAPFPELVQRYVTGPFGMRDTGWQTGESMHPGHDAEGRAMPLTTEMPDLPDAGGLRTSTRDMLIYLQHQLAEDDPAIALTHQSTVVTDDEEVGLNWHIDTLPTGEKTYWHTGGTFGFSSYIVLFPARRLGIVLMTNESDPETQRRLVAIASKIAEAEAG
ncbi:beta-lactamase family protein [Stakelama sp. CBK3Z-3]|uniref:Beta-lactamase family protein n=2 Tax=Stakelama flava TaxID=2860338 RepID=A0ABS6XQ52_9SPHN|nr:beta-lactamase family protein [Stakelama flava]